jgi:K+-transporting ATPase ATPase B chain
MVTTELEKNPLFNRKIVIPAMVDSLKKMNPVKLMKNPVIFVTAIGAVLTTGSFVREIATTGYSGFTLQIMAWLWFTVLFANFAEAIAEGRGKAQAESLRKNRTETKAKRIVNGRDEVVVVPATELRVGDTVVCEAGDVIPCDGEVIEGIASVNESAVTGESAPVIRESGGDRSAVTGGTRVISDRIVVRATSEPGKSFLDRMIALVEGAKRQKTPNEIALTILLSAFTMIFLLAVSTLYPFVLYAARVTGASPENLNVPVLVSLLVCLIPTTIGGLLSAIGISGLDRLVRKNVIATSGKAVEAAGDIDVLLLDKTGTITLGNRMASDFQPAIGIEEYELADAAQLASLSDETPEGRSIVVLAKERYGLRGREVADAHVIPFTAQSQMSGVDIPARDGKPKRELRKGASEAIRRHVDQMGGHFPKEIEKFVEEISSQGGTPLVVADGKKVIGVIHLKDMVKGGIRERFAHLRRMGIRTIMVTGDNPRTAGTIAAEAGVDDFIAQATPEEKLRRIREEQAKGHLVAMTGDGTNDAPALAQADVGVAMNTGTQAAREAGNMVDLDSNPTKLIDIVETGKQMLMTRGALTTFSIANDIAKYFAILPALFGGLYATGGGTGPLSALNIMDLHSPQSAILSAVIFNALVIVALIPLALKGVTYRAMGAGQLLRVNLLIYGLGGIIAPFVGIKFIDILVSGVML